MQGVKGLLQKEALVVGCIMAITLVLVSPRFFSQLLFAPKNHEFVGMTVYFEDFYYYLDQFRQGAEGKWLVENRFTSENLKPTALYFTNLMLGKIGSWIGLESYQSYNYFALLFKFLFILISYVVIRALMPQSLKFRIYTFLIFLYSTSFPNITMSMGKLTFNGSVDVFRAENRIQARFGSSPQGMFVNFLFVLLFLLAIQYLVILWRKVKDDSRAVQSLYMIRYSVIMGCIAAVISINDVSKAVIITLVYCFLGWHTYRTQPTKQFIRWFGASFTGILVPMVIWTLYIALAITQDPVYKQANDWDIHEYFKQFDSMGALGIIKGFGLILPLSLYGAYRFSHKQNKTKVELAAWYVYVLCALFYIAPYLVRMPFPAFRFIFPATYVFGAYFAFYGVRELSRFLPTKRTVDLLMIGYLFICWFTFATSWWKTVQPLKEPNFHFTYIPSNLYKGLVFLRTAEPRDGVVLASPHSAIDLMIPGLGGKRTYSGHFLTTLNSGDKDRKAKAFFYEWTDRPTTHEFLRENNIRFLVVTFYDAVLHDIKTYYPFLIPIFENDMITVFRYDPKE